MNKVFSKRLFYDSKFKCITYENYSYISTNFKPIVIPGLEHQVAHRTQRQPLQRARPKYLDMKGDEDWTNIWPSCRSFNYNVIPLPIRQGFIKNSTENNNVIPEKYGNMELMKIPNFLHLTPGHIEKHCQALKKYCTKWPQELNDVTARVHFPLEFIQTDYLHSAPSIRDNRARVVTLKFELQHLGLNERETIKFVKLIGTNRYDKETNTVTLIGDRCPSHRQNRDYLIYVITALTNESKKFEKWELEAEDSDWLKYKWEQSKLKKNVDEYLEKATIDPEINKNRQAIESKLKSSIETIYNENQNMNAWNDYKDGVLDLFKLKALNKNGNVQN